MRNESIAETDNSKSVCYLFLQCFLFTENCFQNWDFKLFNSNQSKFQKKSARKACLLSKFSAKQLFCYAVGTPEKSVRITG